MNIIRLLLFMLAPLGVFAQQTLFVNPSATGQNNGTSWQNAFTDLHAALSVAQPGDQIWVAAGTYRPTTGTDRNARFVMASGIRLLGGFTGTETSPTQRDWQANPSIFDGDIGVPGDSTDNSYNLLTLDFPDSSTVADGFFFQNALADKPGMTDPGIGSNGAALFINGLDSAAYPDIVRCVFRRNTALGDGGAVFVQAGANGSVAPRFLDCRFEYNRTLNSGGAVRRSGSSFANRYPDFGGCTFLSNTSTNSGGAVSLLEANNRTDTTEVINCSFEKNSAIVFGGAIHYSSNNSLGFNALIKGTTFYKNASRIGAGFSFWSDSYNLKSLIFDDCIFDENIGKTSNPNVQPFGTAMSVYSGDFTDINNFFRINNCTVSNHVSPPTSCIEIASYVSTSIFEDNMVRFNSRGCDFSGKQSYIRGNIFEENGGRFTFDGAGGSVEIENNIFAHNYAGTWHSIVSAASASFSGNAFIGNTTDWSTIPSLSAGSPKHSFKNNIFWGNRNLSYTGNKIWRIPFGKAQCTFDNNLFDFPSCDNIPSMFTCGTGNLFLTDPMFVDSAGGDFRLRPCSPLVNAGTNAPYLPTDTDLAGNPRIADGVADIGAYETPAFAFSQSPVADPTCAGAADGAVHWGAANGCLPYSFSWQNGSASGSDTIGLAGGSYIFTVTDHRGRSLTQTVVVPESNPQVVVQNLSGWLCEGVDDGMLAATVVGGFPPYSFDWQDFVQDSLRTGLGVGVYEVTLTDALGCTDTDTETLALALPPTVQDSIKAASCSTCANGAIMLDLTGGVPPFAFQWSNGDTSTSVSGLIPGLYTLTVTDDGGNGCDYIFMFEVTFTDATRNPTSATLLTILPNPSVGRVWVSGFNGTAAAELFDVKGQPVWSGIFRQGQPLDFGMQTGGVYLLVFTYADGSKSVGRVVIGDGR